MPDRPPLSSAHPASTPSAHGRVPDADGPIVRFYTRPGCGFSFSLRRQLTAIGLPVTEIDIWEDPGAAAFVRSVARGYETVPTVAVGETALVNPSPNEVVALVADRAPALLPDGVEPQGTGWVRRLLGG